MCPKGRQNSRHILHNMSVYKMCFMSFHIFDMFERQHKNINIAFGYCIETITLKINDIFKLRISNLGTVLYASYYNFIVNEKLC